MLRDISLHIHDLVQNSITAGASQIQVEVRVTPEGYLCVQIEDNGCGMSPELLQKVTDPFTTSRTTRNVGMGIPFFKMACEQAGGVFSIRSTLGEGTKTCGTFQVNHIDRLPLGHLGETVMMLIMENPNNRYVFTMSSLKGEYVFDTDQIKDVLDGAPIDEFEILQWIKGYVDDHTFEIFGGVLDEIIRRT